MTVLFSSHQLDLVENLCETVAIIHKRRLVASGAVADLRRGGRPRLAVQVADDPDGAWARSGISPELGEITTIRSGRVFIALTDDGASQRVLDLARSAGVVEHFSHQTRRLSEVFREVTGASVGQAESAHAASGRAAAGAGEAVR